MQLTRHTDYALRVLMLLAARRGEGQATIAGLALALGVSEHHLRKVVNRLAAAGFLESRRGRHGGLSLTREPAEICVGTVVRYMERRLEPVDCARPPCRLSPGCRLRAALDEAMDAFLVTLDAYSLADLASRLEPDSGLAQAAVAG